MPLKTVAPFPRRYQWGCTWWVNMSGLYTQRMHKHTPTHAQACVLHEKHLGRALDFDITHVETFLQWLGVTGEQRTEHRQWSLPVLKCWHSKCDFSDSETHRHKQIHTNTWDKDKHARLPRSAKLSNIFFKSFLYSSLTFNYSVQEENVCYSWRFIIIINVAR